MSLFGFEITFASLVIVAVLFAALEADNETN